MIRSGLVLAFLLISGLAFLGCGDSGGSSFTAPPNGSGFQITTTGFPTATVGEVVSASISTANGQAPYTYAVVAGGLPPTVGLNNTNGTLSGTVTTAGSFDFTMRVTDGSGAQAERALTWEVSDPPVEWNPGFTFPSGTVNQQYVLNLNQAVSGGTQPLTFAVVSGSLPQGLTLTSDGLLSGTPTSAGTESVIVSVTSSPDPGTGTRSQAQYGGDITIN